MIHDDCCFFFFNYYKICLYFIFFSNFMFEYFFLKCDICRGGISYVMYEVPQNVFYGLKTKSFYFPEHRSGNATLGYINKH